ncbi:MAG: hypothetical protein ACM3XM_19870 [Mycobacterium leprae]
MLQGDVHRFYLKMRQRFPVPPDGRIADLDHVRVIADYYARITPEERSLLLAWAKKEQSGMGLIPFSLSGIPLIGLVFTPLLQPAIHHVRAWAWYLLWGGSVLLFVAGIYVHQRQQAYTTLHVHLLETLCRVKEEPLPQSARPQL